MNSHRERNSHCKNIVIIIIKSEYYAFYNLDTYCGLLG